MRLPFDLLPASLAKNLQSPLWLMLLGILTAALSVPMRSHSDALIGPLSPLGILSLQFTFSPDAASLMLASWFDTGLQHARLSLYWDMAFAPAYGMTLAALTTRLIAAHRRTGFAVIAWMPIWAALADWLENLLHLCLVSGGCESDLPLASLACCIAIGKWSLLMLWLTGLLWIVYDRFKTASDSDRSD